MQRVRQGPREVCVCPACEAKRLALAHGYMGWGWVDGCLKCYGCPCGARGQPRRPCLRALNGRPRQLPRPLQVSAQRPATRRRPCCLHAPGVHHGGMHDGLLPAAGLLLAASSRIALSFLLSYDHISAAVACTPLPRPMSRDPASQWSNFLRITQLILPARMGLSGGSSRRHARVSK